MSIYYFIQKIFKNSFGDLDISKFSECADGSVDILTLCEHTVGTPDVSTSAAGNAVYALRAVKCVQMYALDQTERD